MTPLVHTLSTVLVATLGLGITQGEKKTAAGPLDGVWVAQQMVSRGQTAPDTVVANIRFTFKGDKVTIRGNRGDDSEDICSFTIDTSASPRRIDIVNPNGVTMEGIYEVAGDVLKIALGRPRPADYTPGPAVIVFTLKKGA